MQVLQLKDVDLVSILYSVDIINGSFPDLGIFKTDSFNVSKFNQTLFLDMLNKVGAVCTDPRLTNTDLSLGLQLLVEARVEPNKWHTVFSPASAADMYGIAMSVYIASDSNNSNCYLAIALLKNSQYEEMFYKKLGAAKDKMLRSKTTAIIDVFIIAGCTRRPYLLNPSIYPSAMVLENIVEGTDKHILVNLSANPREVQLVYLTNNYNGKMIDAMLNAGCGGNPEHVKQVVNEIVGVIKEHGKTLTEGLINALALPIDIGDDKYLYVINRLSDNCREIAFFKNPSNELIAAYTSELSEPA